MEFLKQRAINIFTDMKYRKDIVIAVLDKDFDNLIDAEEKIKVLEEFVKDSAFGELLAIVKRVGNISKDYTSTEVKSELFVEDIEKELYNFSTILSTNVDQDLENKDYRKYLSDITDGKNIINSYFDQIKVMDKDENIKNNRLSELRFLTEIFTRMADLNKIDEK